MGSFFFPLKTGHHHHHQIGPNTEHQMQWHESCQCQCLPDCLPRSCKSATHQASIISQRRATSTVVQRVERKKGREKGSSLHVPLGQLLPLPKPLRHKLGTTHAHTKAHNRLTDSKVQDKGADDEGGGEIATVA